MDSTSLTKPVDLQGLSLALAHIKADYEGQINRKADTLVSDVWDSEGNSVVQDGIAMIPEGFSISVVQSLPSSDIDTHTIYLVRKAATVGSSTVGTATVGSQVDSYDEYIYVNNAWEKLGDDIDTEAFARVGDIPTKVSDLTDDVGIITEWTQSDWNEDDIDDPAYVVNRPAIRAGEGGNSIVMGAITNSYDPVTLLLTGTANATTYTYTTEDTLPTQSEASMQNFGFIQYINGSATTYRYITGFNPSNNSISLNSTLNSTNNLSNVSVSLYYAYKGAFGTNSVAEASANNSAIGNLSHAEGSGTFSIGGVSHAEGSLTRATGLASHTEGSNTVSSGYYSHAEGSHTIANHMAQHVFGAYNIEDPSTAGAISRGNYVEIVGNGDSTTRSNARTLDWSGNEILAGKLTVGAGPTNNMDVATKQYVDTAISGGGSSDVMIVTVTGTYDEGTGETTYSSDKTFAEISAHINGGGIAVCNYDNVIFNLFVITPDDIRFSYTEVINDFSGEDTYIHAITEIVQINDDNSIDYLSAQEISKLISNDISDGQILIFDEEEYAFKNSPIPAQNATIAMTNNVITLTNASGTTSTIALPVYSGSVSTVGGGS